MSKSSIPLNSDHQAIRGILKNSEQKEGREFDQVSIELLSMLG